MSKKTKKSPKSASPLQVSKKTETLPARPVTPLGRASGFLTRAAAELSQAKTEHGNKLEAMVYNLQKKIVRADEQMHKLATRAKTKEVKDAARIAKLAAQLKKLGVEVKV